jgi:uncharacterized membrane protein
MSAQLKDQQHKDDADDKLLKAKRAAARKRFAFFFLLFVSLSAFNTLSVHFSGRNHYFLLFARLCICVFFVFGGIAHFTMPKFYVHLMPPFFGPTKLFLVYLSGVFEIVLGIFTVIPHPIIGNVGAWGLFWLLWAVYPANIWAALSAETRKLVGMTHTQSLIRLPIQFLFAYWAYQLIDSSFAEMWFGFWKLAGIAH